MRRVLAVLGSVVFLLIAPGIVAGLAPWWIAERGYRYTIPWPLQGIGAMLIAAGTWVLVDSFARFALRGLGTPAPVFPTRHLVAAGFYQFVRNPMYIAVLAVILGQSFWLGSARVLAYAGLVWLAFHVFVVAYEEPTLRRTYGAQYEDFCSNVPRWIPRLRPW